MGDIDPLAGNVSHLQDSLAASVAPADSSLVRLEVGQDGTIQSVQLSAAARAMTPDALVAEVVRVHTAAVEESQRAISAAIAALEADPRLAALTERKTDALSRALPTQTHPPTSAAPVSRPSTGDTPVSLPANAIPPSSDHNTAGPSRPTPVSPPQTPVAPVPRPAVSPRQQPTQQAPWPSPSSEQPPARSRQPTPEEEEEMDRYYGRKSWLEY
ncbi:hypothetical protein [Nocardia sp. NPDC023988]|uniref:hypothetical protein n=1 Tax=unclassified Nocardia TaxID=2637762 RepID=UPI0033C933D7